MKCAACSWNCFCLKTKLWCVRGHETSIEQLSWVTSCPSYQHLEPVVQKVIYCGCDFTPLDDLQGFWNFTNLHKPSSETQWKVLKPLVREPSSYSWEKAVNSNVFLFIMFVGIFIGSQIYRVMFCVFLSFWEMSSWWYIFRGHIFSAPWSPPPLLILPPLRTLFFFFSSLSWSLWELCSVFCVRLCQRLGYTDLIWNVRTDRSRSQAKLPTRLFFLLTFELQQSHPSRFVLFFFKHNQPRIVSEHECRLVACLVCVFQEEMTKLNKCTLFN